MNEITTVPENVSNAGYTFNYALWTAGTVVTLVNVPWDSDYRNVMEPGYNYDAFINAQTKKTTVSQMKLAQLNKPIRISTPFEVASQYNYVRATNPAQPVAGSLPSTYYYFIKEVEYSAPNTTTLVLQLDVWATFINKVSFGRTYVSRGHAGVANDRQLQNNGRDYLTIPEGLDTGGEMLIRKVYHEHIADARKPISNPGLSDQYSIMITTTVDLESDEWLSDDPKVITAKGSNMENLPHGGGIYIFKSFHWFETFLIANKKRSWVTQGISSIQVIPDIDEFQVPVDEVGIVGVGNGVYKPRAGTIPNKQIDFTTDWFNDVDLLPRYKHLHKFRVYPYTVIEATAYSGQPIVLKPESIQSRKLSMSVLLHLAPGSGRLSFVPLQYNTLLTQVWNDDAGMIADSGEWLDLATTIANFPQYSTVNSSYAAFMQTNKNQVAFQQESARWDQTRAMAGAQTAAANAQSGIDQTGQSALNQQTFNQQMLNTNMVHRGVGGGIDMLSSGVSAGAQALGGGGVAGLVSGAAGMAAAGGNAVNDMVQMNQQTAHSNQLSAANARASVLNQNQVMDSNLALGRMAAQGDYSNAIAGIEARVQDMKMLQPTTSGQIGGESFLLAKMGWGLWCKVKTVAGNAQYIIGEYWLRYGYNVHAWFTPPANLQVMSKFSFWQTLETSVFADGCPESYRMTIRGIMEKGVTVWKNAVDIGKVDPATNVPVGGFSY